MNARGEKILWGVVSAGMVVDSLSRCAAAAGESVDGHVVPKAEGTVPWVAIAYLVVTLLGVSAAAFKNSKRTHLD